MPGGMLKNWIKHKATRHRQGKEKNIFIFSTARSGTTWLAEMLATQGRFKIVNEPFNLRMPVVRENLGLDSWQSLFLPENKARMVAYLQSFESGGDTDLRFKREAPFSEFWHPVTDRIIYKILFAGEDNIGCFADQSKGHVILLLRHPIAVSVSREEFPRLESFLMPPFADHFSAEQLAFAREIIARGVKFEVAIVDWCLQNAVPLRQRDPGWLVLSYEQLAVEPQIVVDQLARRLGLTNREAMLASLYRASRSTTKSKADSQRILRDPQKMRTERLWLIEKWKRQVTPEQETRAYAILRTFGIDMYEEGSFMPASRYLLAGVQ